MIGRSQWIDRIGIDLEKKKKEKKIELEKHEINLEKIQNYAK